MEFGRTEALHTPVVGSTSQTVQHKGREESPFRQKGKRHPASLPAQPIPSDQGIEGEPHHTIDIRI